jgi:hypothetical protein
MVSFSAFTQYVERHVPKSTSFFEEYFLGGEGDGSGGSHARSVHDAPRSRVRQRQLSAWARLPGEPTAEARRRQREATQCEEPSRSLASQDPSVTATLSPASAAVRASSQ